MLLFDKTNKKPKEKGGGGAQGCPCAARMPTTGLEEEERRVEQAARRKEDAREPGKTSLSAIGYDAMYADRTAPQVEEGLFSQTIEFRGHQLPINNT